MPCGLFQLPINLNYLARFGTVGDMPDLDPFDYIVQDLRCRFCAAKGHGSINFNVAKVSIFSYD